MNNKPLSSALMNFCIHNFKIKIEGSRRNL